MTHEKYEIQIREGFTLIATNLATAVAIAPAPAAVIPAGYDPYELITKRGFETAGELLRREFPSAEIFPI